MIVLAFIGAVVLALLALKILVSFYKTFLRPGKNLKKLGKWAVVTGATDGIGKAYAMALAKKGLSVVLISRTESKLKEVKEEIENKGYNVEVKYVVCDYSKFNNKSVRDAVAKEVAGLEVGVLINNVGMSYSYTKYFHELNDEDTQGLITMNIESTLWMTRMVLPGMLERKSGAIVNISSGSALYSLPLLSEYAGAKSFVEKFSRGLNAEYQAKGVTCQVQVPFYVATKLAKMRKSMSVPTPKEYVASAINWVGYPDCVVSPFWIHACMGYIMFYIPEFILNKVITSMHLAIRKKGKAKEERLAKEKAQGKKE